MAAVPQLTRPPPLTAIPKGLLGFLGIKNGGQYPQNLVNVLSPTWDLRDHYVESYAAEFLQGPINLAAGTTSGDLSFGTTIGFVPQTELAYVTDYSARCDLAGLGAVTGTPAVFKNGLAFGVGPTITFAAGSLASWRADRPFWMTPGAALGVIVNLKVVGDALAFYAISRSVIFPN